MSTGTFYSTFKEPDLDVYQPYTSLTYGIKSGTRRKREFTPDELKDSNYWFKRSRNNEAAKRSRQRKRVEEKLLETRAVHLQRENDKLKAALSAVHHGYASPNHHLGGRFCYSNCYPSTLVSLPQCVYSGSSVCSLKEDFGSYSSSNATNLSYQRCLYLSDGYQSACRHKELTDAWGEGAFIGSRNFVNDHTALFGLPENSNSLRCFNLKNGSFETTPNNVSQLGTMGGGATEANPSERALSVVPKLPHKLRYKSGNHWVASTFVSS